VAPKGLTDAFAAPELLLAADDERVTRTHVEYRDHDPPAQRVDAADLRNAINAPPARPQPKDSTGTRQTPELKLDPPAHLAVRVLDAARVTDDPGDKESGHAWLQSARASVLAQRLAERPRMRPILELRHPFGRSRGLPMHRVLQPLHELLEMRDPRLERPNLILSRIDARRLPRRLSRCPAANLTDPRHQSIKLGHSSPPARTRRRCGAAGVLPPLILCHAPDLLSARNRHGRPNRRDYAEGHLAPSSAGAHHVRKEIRCVG
jgi:hypothetical protein